MRRKWIVLAQFELPSVRATKLAWIIGQNFGLLETLPGSVENIVRFGIAHGLGATIYAYRDRIGFHWIGIPIWLSLGRLLRDGPALEV